MKAIALLIKIFFLMCIIFSACTPVPVQVTTTPVIPDEIVPTQTPDQAVFIPADIPGEVLYIPFPFEIEVNGELSDWDDLPFYYVDNGPSPSPDPAENGSFRFSVAADLENFYITMQMPDKNIVAGKHGVEFWNEDSMEFYINASGDLSASSYKTNIFQININAADIGNSDPERLTITGVFSTGIPVKGFVFKTDEGWGFEASVPLEGIVKPTHGQEIGFQSQINGATTLDRDIKLIWAKADTADNSWQYPYLFGRGIFFELGREDIPEPSVVQTLPTATVIPPADIILPMVKVNQIGYLPEGSKIAILADESTTEQDWILNNQNGETVASGKTIIKGLDSISGDHIHIIDFSDYEAPGENYKLIANNIESSPFKISNDLYSQMQLDAMAYFYHNRSGIPIKATFVGKDWERPAGHITDNNVACYKGVDADGNNWPGCEYTLDVAGGWYDAGDFGKYVVNGGISAWTLLNLYEQFPDVFPDGSLSIPEQSNGIPDILDEARWEMEFLLSMQVPLGQNLSGMVHHKIHDLTWAPIPMVPPTEIDNDNDHKIESAGRYLFPPSSAATLNLAATAAQSARIWRDVDPEFSEKCLKAAEIAWEAAIEHQGIFYGNIPGQGGGNYDDQNVSDEFYWAAAELFITTGKDNYESYLLNSEKFGTVEQFDWGRTGSLGTISLLTVKNNLAVEKIEILKNELFSFSDEMLTIQQKDGYSVLINGAYPWGSNGLILNNMILMGLTHKVSGDPDYLKSVRQSMDYIMGRNPMNQSYVSGYGTFSMQHPHHRFWANDLNKGFPPPPAGALSGGPNANPDDPVAQNANLSSLPESKRYIDDIGSFTTNEVTINWNAPLVWVSSYLNTFKE
ncbi:MAG: glycoside hydrolase family 9 protein [Anaerolineaceae bacterium]|nr:glycoside hydrolase family 9 protein [Anaerolineaceae bacterium]